MRLNTHRQPSFPLKGISVSNLSFGYGNNKFALGISFLNSLSLLNYRLVNIFHRLWFTTFIGLFLFVALRSSFPSRLVLASVAASGSLEHVPEVFRETSILPHPIHEVNSA
jgi:hypothetical protein